MKIKYRFKLENNKTQKIKITVFKKTNRTKTRNITDKISLVRLFELIVDYVYRHDIKLNFLVLEHKAGTDCQPPISDH